MKLKAPPGVGDPCVAGVAIASRNGIYEVEPEIGALLIECFGFIEIGVNEKAEAPAKRPTAPAPAAPPAQRRPASAPLPKLSLPAWRTRPVANKP